VKKSAKEQAPNLNMKYTLYTHINVRKRRKNNEKDPASTYEMPRSLCLQKNGREKYSHIHKLVCPSLSNPKPNTIAEKKHIDTALAIGESSSTEAPII
jgi:hypothetical protein